MNILYIGPSGMADYQSDMLFHGLRSTAGLTVTDYPRQDRMYSDYSDLSSLYGRGFTLYGLLDPIAIDRARILERVVTREFDLIVYGSVTRAVTFLKLVTDIYPPEKIVFIDGEDHPILLPDLALRGIYFKRELATPTPNVYPIHFAIPAEKIGTLKHMRKGRVRAYIDPRDRTTYVYKDEPSYYADYATALFAYTTKKAGWDTLRTLEIMANNCIPLFLDIAQCPRTTCINLPKDELAEALHYSDHDGLFWDRPEGMSLWQSLHRRIHLKFTCFSTTLALARYFLDTVHHVQQEAA